MILVQPFNGRHYPKRSPYKLCGMSRYSTKIMGKYLYRGKKKSIYQQLYTIIIQNNWKTVVLTKCMKFILSHFPNKLVFTCYTGTCTCYKGAYENEALGIEWK